MSTLNKPQKLVFQKPSKAIIVTIFGIRGSGKSKMTSAIADAISQNQTLVIFDVADEWGGKYVSDFDSFIAMKKAHPKLKVFVVKFHIDQSNEEMIFQTESIIRWFYNNGEPVTMVFEEAQVLFPLHGTSELMKRLIMLGRHRHISIVANTQRPAQIYKGLLSQSEFVFCGKLFEKNDIQYLSGTIGKTNAEQLPKMPDYSFIEFEAGNAANQNKIVTL